VALALSPVAASFQLAVALALSPVVASFQLAVALALIPQLGNSRPLVGNLRLLVGNSRPLVGNSRPLVGNSQPLVGNSRPRPAGAGDRRKLDERGRILASQRRLLPSPAAQLRRRSPVTGLRQADREDRAGGNYPGPGDKNRPKAEPVDPYAHQRRNHERHRQRRPHNADIPRMICRSRG